MRSTSYPADQSDLMLCLLRISADLYDPGARVQSMRSAELLGWQIHRASVSNRAYARQCALGVRSYKHVASNLTVNQDHSVGTKKIRLPFLPVSVHGSFQDLSLRPLLSRRFSLQRFLRDAHNAANGKERKSVNSTELQEDKKPSPDENESVPENEERGFVRSEKASQAAQVNLSARLAKDGLQPGQTAGWGEIWRLIKIARPEAGVLGFAFIFLLISSSISMSIPFSIGKILDIATKQDGGDQIFGMDLPTFYVALGGVLALGAGANYGRIIILRIVGERIVARLRSSLFRRTFVQNAEFFDANRVGDLISRLSSDTIIVGKSITQNLSDGLRSLVSGGAGFGLMAYVSLKLTGILSLMFPPVAIGAYFYGQAIRNLSRRIQKNLGTLSKIAEERLGNVRTSQAFAGEILEVSRYNKQVRKIFELGKTEALISATFFSTVSFTKSSTDCLMLISTRQDSWVI